MSALVGVLLVAVAQAPVDVASLSPYMIRVRGEGQPLYVLVDASTLDDVHFDAYLDEPWLGPLEERRESIQRSNVIDFAPQDPAPRRQRLKDGWEAHGGIQIDTPSGRRWVLKSEYDWAQKAVGIERAAYARPVAGEALDTTTPEAASEEAERPGFWALWGPHVGIVGGGLVLCGLVLGYAVRSRSWRAVDSGSR